LDLGNNKITDSGVLELCKALSETEVSRFVISNNKLTDKCCEQVTGVLMRNKHLTVLNMQDNQINSRVAKNKLVNALPKIDVVI
jgi:Leucine-rich repeat (LRR) protein